MKKIYSKPVTEVVNIETSRILCLSGDDQMPDLWGGEFGQVPGLTPEGMNHLA